MRTLLITAVAVVATAVGVAAAAPTRTPAKKPAGAGATTKPAAARTQPASRPAAPPEIRKGMTLAEAERIAGYSPKPERETDDGTRYYMLNVWDRTGDVAVRREYHLAVVDGVIVRYSLDYHEASTDRRAPAVKAPRRQ